MAIVESQFGGFWGSGTQAFEGRREKLFALESYNHDQLARPRGRKSAINPRGLGSFTKGDYESF
jgi:hypothetical protein